MGKGEEQNLPLQWRREVAHSGNSSGVLCKELNFKCLFVLILGFVVFVPGFFWLLPLHQRNSGFEAKDAIKLSATVQVYFVLEKPVKELLPHIKRLEFDINGELDIPNVKVSILSMHDIGLSNRTYVVFGLLSEYITAPINPVSLSLLRSSLYDLFLHESNLTLTTSIFGQPSTFEILKFPGGISIIPFQHASIWHFPQIVFNFTLTNSISEILDHFAKFRSEVKVGLRLRPYENVYFQITNKIGSTMQQSVIVQASISSELGRISLQRLQQLAAIINSSPERNLGLDYSVFGEVKSVSLSSYLKGTSNAMPPSFSPAPAPAPGASHPARSSSHGLAQPPENHSPPHTNCKTLPPTPSMVPAHSPRQHSIPPISYPKSTTRLIVPPADQPRVSSPHASLEGEGFPPLLPPDVLPKPKPSSFGSKPGQTKEDSHPDNVSFRHTLLLCIIWLIIELNTHFLIHCIHQSSNSFLSHIFVGLKISDQGHSPPSSGHIHIYHYITSEERKEYKDRRQIGSGRKLIFGSTESNRTEAGCGNKSVITQTVKQVLFLSPLKKQRKSEEKVSIESLMKKKKKKKK